MALFNCTECGREISDKAVSCPHCGCPVTEQHYNDRFFEFENTQSKKTTYSAPTYEHIYRSDKRQSTYNNTNGCLVALLVAFGIFIVFGIIFVFAIIGTIASSSGNEFAFTSQNCSHIFQYFSILAS